MRMSLALVVRNPRMLAIKLVPSSPRCPCPVDRDHFYLAVRNVYALIGCDSCWPAVHSSLGRLRPHGMTVNRISFHFK